MIETEVDKDEFWALVLESLEVKAPSPQFNSRYGRMIPVSYKDGTLKLASPNQFQRDWFMKGIDLVRQSAQEVAGKEISIQVVVDESIITEQIEPKSPTVNEIIAEDIKEEHAIPRGILDEKYTFDNFIAGDSNSFARSIAMNVAEHPGQRYNPLFISGGSGLGKTHLLQAIGNYITQVYPHKKVIYTTAEEFFNDFMSVINPGSSSSEIKDIGQFHKMYREVDVLLMDDIQFIEGKIATMEQFFHTFETLYNKKAQIVVTSDRAAAEINMAERMITRFQMGVEADVLPPSYELRYAIIKSLFEKQSIPVRKEVFEYLADKNVRSVREIEGAVNIIIAFAELSHQSIIDLEMTQKTTAGLFKNQMNHIVKVATIQSEVCKFFKVNKNDLLGSKRQQSIVYPRHIAMYLTQELTDLSYPLIGREFGDRDHTTVMHAVEKIKKMIKSDPQVIQQIEMLTEQIKRQQ